MEGTTYEYSGFLQTLLHRPDASMRDSLEHVEFGPDDLENWALLDVDTEEEWQHIPAFTERTEQGIVLGGRFEDVRRMDALEANDPSYWVPLSSRRWHDPRLPVDLRHYPIVELTYRCKTENARPAWLLHYEDGVHFDGLAPTMEWRTIVRKIRHNEFPNEITGMTFRLFSTSRATEQMEIASIRFRVMSPGEAEACEKYFANLDSLPPPRHSESLDDFLPIGVYVLAGTAKRMAETLAISLEEYWQLALEDIVRHNHNAVLLQGVEELSPQEWQYFVEQAGVFGLRILPMRFPGRASEEEEVNWFIEQYVRPAAHNPCILGWIFEDEPPESAFEANLRIRRIMEEVAPGQPVAVLLREPTAYNLYGPHFAASGLAHFRSNSSWDVSPLVRRHLPLNRGRQFWLVGPTFVYATDTPKWNTCPEVRLMLNSAFASGARGWFAFAYNNDPFWLGGSIQRTLTGPFLTFSDLWSELGQRVERFSVLAPLMLQASPSDPPEVDMEVRSESHPHSKRPEEIPRLQRSWMQGPNFHLLYLINNDINEVTPVYIDIPDTLAEGMEVYDMTDFVRSRAWSPMERKRHIEMFPGQGQIILAAEKPVCEFWRDRIASHMMVSDRREVEIDLRLIRKYGLDVSQAEMLLEQIGSGAPLVDLLQMRDVREHLINLAYESESLVRSRSKLIEASAGICACDGALCRLMTKGKAEAVPAFGDRLLPMARDMAHLRIELRAGAGAEIHEACEALSRKSLELLAEIRAAT